jgi:hypothetical protein
VPGLGVSAGDYNGDGWPDLYVANDATPNQLWINRHDGTFVDEGVISGSALSAAGNPEGSMGIASGDFDLDGDEDLFVTNIAGETSVLYLNDGHGNFEDVRARTGLARLTAAFTGFGTDWFDYDNDGWPDLFIANGAVNIVEAQRGQPSPFKMTNQLFHNLEGRRFEDASALGGPVFARAEISRGAAFGDIDNDGDVDIVFTNNNGPVRLLINQASRQALAAGETRPAPGQPVRDRRLGGCRANRASDALAAGAHRRQLPVGERRPGALRARRGRGSGRDCGAVAGRPARAVYRRRHGPHRHASSRRRTFLIAPLHRQHDVPCRKPRS